MTLNKDLEERIDKELVFGVVIIAVMISVGISAIMIVVSSHSWFESTSPCELGLMEWGHEMKLFSSDCFYDKEDAELFAFHSQEVYFDKEYGMWCYDNFWPEKSCPYSGPGIMVVKQ